MTSLADYLQLTADYLPAELIDASRQKRLLQWAATFPAVGDLLLECPLGGQPGRLDISFFCRAPTEWKRLFEAIQQQLTLHPEYPCFSAFSREEPPYGNNGLWLEFDGVGETTDNLYGFPAVFVRFQPAQSGTDDEKTDRSILIEQLQEKARRISHDRWAPIKPGLELLLTVLPSHAVVGHLGLMWSRKMPTLRLNIGGLKRVETANLLSAIGVGGGSSLERALSLAYTSGYGTVLCLDIASTILPRIGFELFPRDPSSGKETWLPVQRRLLEAKLCQPEQAIALDHWPRMLTPINTSLPWPADAMVESLLRAPDEFTSVILAVNHFKLVIEPENKLLAKTYLSISHNWGTLEDPAPPAFSR